MTAVTAATVPAPWRKIAASASAVTAQSASTAAVPAITRSWVSALAG